MITSRLFDEVRRHAGRASWAVAEQGANPVLQLALIPFLLKGLGGADFGIWVLANTFIGISPLASFGAGMATIKHVSADLGTAAPERAIGVIRAALAVAGLGGIAVAVLSWMVAPIAAGLFFTQMGSPEHLVPVLMLCGLGAAINEIDAVFASALRGAERFDLCAKIEVISRLLMAVVIVVLMTRSSTVLRLFCALLLMMALKAAIKGWQVQRLFGSLAACLPSFNRAPLQRVCGFGIWQWLQSAGTVFFSAADQWVVGSMLGAGALSRYSICLQLAQNVHLLPSVMMQVIFPRISSKGERLGAARGNEILRSATILAVGAAVLLGLPLIVLAQPLLSVWIGAEFARDNQWLLTVLVIAHVILSINIGAYFVLLATGRTARSAVVVLGAGALQIGSAVIAAPFGLLAVAASRFTYAILTAFLYRLARFREN